MKTGAPLAALLLVVATGTELRAQEEAGLTPREACAVHEPLRRALFGDLHVHTSYSMDAYLFDTRTTPDDAYRFARGEAISIAPLDDQGNGSYSVKLERPLDFAAVTDHAENFGSTALCTRPESPVWSSESCRMYRGELPGEPIPSSGLQARYVIARMLAATTDEVCGPDGRSCRFGTGDVWREMVEVAEKHYDRSADCRFTSFAAYEYGLTPKLSKIHRNVIFRNERVLDYPIHAQMETNPVHLWRRLRRECIENRPGCDVLAIPHNSNLSDDHMFALDYDGSRNLVEERRIARLRSAMEPLVEIMQIKGDSECRNGLAGVGGPPDELCGFEKVRSNQYPTVPPDCEGVPGEGALGGRGCVGRDSYARYALIQGLAEARRLGENPLRFGFIASTDEHKGTMGDVDEWAYVDRPIEERVAFNPGGLMGVWAEENSRNSIFDAMRRRETFATSGPRIRPRFFGGWEHPAGTCDATGLVERGYAAGVPMGGILPPRPDAAAAPSFVVSAMRDPGTPEHPGGLLQRVQIVKGWVGDGDTYMQKVFEVAGSPGNGADVDLDRCEPRGAGHDALCGVWSDPEFDPGQHAVYYARVVENPSCRWSTRVCEKLRGDPRRPQACDDPRIPKTIQERAWTSPIWYDAP
ncbi:MAG: DUF3604 domain-containing protein [Proteobacteria bacterium]|nr:DUF3604 domain-containing protein [Pseudomonadota bacterium]